MLVFITHKYWSVEAKLGSQKDECVKSFAFADSVLALFACNLSAFCGSFQPLP